MEFHGHLAEMDGSEWTFAEWVFLECVLTYPGKNMYMASPVNLTTTARTASKFYPRNSSQSPDLFRQDLIGEAISGL